MIFAMDSISTSELYSKRLAYHTILDSLNRSLNFILFFIITCFLFYDVLALSQETHIVPQIFQAEFLLAFADFATSISLKGSAEIHI